MDRSSIKASLIIGFIACLVAYVVGYQMRDSDARVETLEARETGYKEGQLDALKGIQIYEQATYEDGTIVVLERNSIDSVM